MYKQSLPIYPSQLSDFKVKAKKFTSIIEELSGREPLSAFQRNDWLALCLGYKGHSGLVHIAKSRESADKNAQLVIFSKNRYFTDNIISIFSKKLPNVNLAHIQSAIRIMASNEREERFNLRVRLRPIEQILPITDNSLRIIANALNKKDNPEIFGIFLLLLSTGLRLNELLRIKIDDVNKDSITLERNNNHKNKKRYIKLNELEKNIIHKIMKRNHNSTFLFQSKSKNDIKPLHPSTVYKAFKKFSINFGINLTPSILRKTFYYHLIKTYETKTEFFKLLPHSNVNLIKHYINLSLDNSNT